MESMQCGHCRSHTTDGFDFAWSIMGPCKVSSSFGVVNQLRLWITCFPADSSKEVERDALVVFIAHPMEHLVCLFAVTLGQAQGACFSCKIRLRQVRFGCAILVSGGRPQTRRLFRIE